MTINQNLLNNLSEQAKASPRLRMVFDLRNTPDENSQRMLNALEPGTIVPIHRHRNSSETIACIRGCLVVEFYDELERICTDAIELSSNGHNVAVNVPIGQWHSLRSLESGSVLLEAKDGKYEPLGDEDILKL